MKVVIKYRSPTCNPEDPFMPMFLYKELLDVIKETNDTVIVQYNHSEFYTYEFNKEYIEKIL